MLWKLLETMKLVILKMSYDEPTDEEMMRKMMDYET